MWCWTEKPRLADFAVWVVASSAATTHTAKSANRGFSVQHHIVSIGERHYDSIQQPSQDVRTLTLKCLVYRCLVLPLLLVNHRQRHNNGPIQQVSRRRQLLDAINDAQALGLEGNHFAVLVQFAR